MCQYQYVRLFWDIFLALLVKNYKLCCWVLRGSVENSSWGQLLPISRAMSNYEGGATQAALLPHVTPATPSGCCGQQPNAVSCFLRLTLKWMGVTRLAFIVRANPNQARLCLASEIGRDRACSEWYGRKQRQWTTEGLIYSQWQTRLTQSVCQNGKKSLALLTQLLWLLFVRKARAYQASWTSLYAPNFNTVTTTAICEESSCLKSKLIFSVSFQFYIAVE